MATSPKIFGIVLAGGEGKRLMPLTADRAKPAVPFGGQYRLIDFAISNLINSGLRQIVVLTQYKSHSLDRHISQTWRMSPMLSSYVASVPAQQRLGKRWFSGSADAILQSMNLIIDEQPDIVIVIGAAAGVSRNTEGASQIGVGAGGHRCGRSTTAQLEKLVPRLHHFQPKGSEDPRAMGASSFGPRSKSCPRPC